jgi:uncharacterized protein YqjF (DUF2071 family)
MVGMKAKYMDTGHSANSSPKGVFLTAEWRHLVMLNYEVDPGLLLKSIPAGTELDQWNGKTFLSLVGFRFLNTKVFGTPFPFHRNFEEVNLRFYVRRQEQEEIRRGVVFIREIVPRWAIATVARTVYNENYVSLPMSHQIQTKDSSELVVEYTWKTGIRWNRIGLSVKGNPALPKAGSEEQFITEHYWGYAAQRDHGCTEYRVAHPAWGVWSGENVVVEGDMEELYGKELAAVLRNPPTSAFLADGSEVTVSRGRKL